MATKASGHGISQAVRNHIPIWINEQVAHRLFLAVQKLDGKVNELVFKAGVRNPENWKRTTRILIESEYRRWFRCETHEKLGLVVISSLDDQSANGYVITVDNKIAANGFTKLQSVNSTDKLSKDKTQVTPEFAEATEQEIKEMGLRWDHNQYYEREL